MIVKLNDNNLSEGYYSDEDYNEVLHVLENLSLQEGATFTFSSENNGIIDATFANNKFGTIIISLNCKDLDTYLFDDCEKYSYNAISIETLKNNLTNAKNKLLYFEEQVLCDFIDTWEALIEIFDEEGITETEDVLVWVYW